MLISSRRAISLVLNVLAVVAITALPFLTRLPSVAAQASTSTEVSIVDFAFNPIILRIAAGTTVTWTNRGNQQHTVTASDGSFDSGPIESGGEFTFTFDDPGTYTYVCSLHPTMQGQIVVEAQPVQINSTAVAAPRADAARADYLPLAQATGFSAAVHTGDCAAPGEEVARLTNVVVPSGIPAGNTNGIPTATSFTTIPLPLEAVLASDHAIQLSNPEDATTIACGDVGGFLADTGSLAIGMESEAGSGVSGVAFFTPGPDPGTSGVSLFLMVPGSLPNAVLAEDSAEQEAPAVSDVEEITEAPIDSGGLGLTVDDFHARHGTGQSHVLGEDIQAANGGIIMSATEEGQVDTIDRYFDQGVTFDDARFIGLQLAPADAVLVDTYLTAVGSTVDLFYSPSLASAFPPTELIGDTEYSTWTNGEPGQFTIGYGGYNPINGINEVTRIILALGNNP